MEKWLEKGTRIWRYASRKNIPVYAAYSAYFIILSIFPMLVLMLGLLRYAGLSADALTELLKGMIPQALHTGAKRLIQSAYRNLSGRTISLSALAALWSASRGIHGLMRGLNTICDTTESRSWLHTRVVSMVYTVLFLGVLFLTLALSVFGSSLARSLPDSPFTRLLQGLLGMRFLVLLALQTGLFCALFLTLPSKRSRLREALPGAVLASLGWQVFSGLFSVYVKAFSGYANVYGSVYAVALTMLWLYICLSIVFYGSAWNQYLLSDK